MSCIHLTLIFLSLSACEPQAAQRAWMQRAELRADAQPVRFVADERGLRPPEKIEAALEAMVLDTVRAAARVAALTIVAEVRFLTRALRPAVGDHRRVIASGPRAGRLPPPGSARPPAGPRSPGKVTQPR